jgi:hypothetical protein
MSTIDYKALAERVAQRAIYADNNADPNNKAWAADLRAVVSLLNGMADAQPVAYRQWDSDDGYWYYGDASCAEKDDELLYAHPAPAVPTGDYSANGEPLYTPPAVPTIEERGPWSAGQDKQQAWEQRVWIESDDFAHDVRLYVNGDFESHDQRFAYAQEIARRLNAAPAAPQAEPKRDSVPIPHDADQAVLMTMVGVAWLQANAPDRLSTRFSELIKQRGGSDAE